MLVAVFSLSRIYALPKENIFYRQMEVALDILLLGFDFLMGNSK
jgi:hypothetical protein